MSCGRGEVALSQQKKPSRFACIFEDKKFSNFFPLSLGQPVFDLRIGGWTLRERLQIDLGSDVGVLCREYLGPVLARKEPEVTVNDVPDGDVLFVNGRLLCYDSEFGDLLDRIPDKGIAVKGGYVVAAKLSGESARDFANYIRRRISEETIEKLCAELRGYVETVETPAKSRRRKSPIVSAQVAEGTFEDDHVTGQDSVAEKLPQALLQLVDRHNLTRLDMAEARLLSFPWQIIEENPSAIEDDFKKSRFRGQSEESLVYPGVKMVNEENIVVGGSASIRPGVVLDASSGPIIINDGSVLMPNAVILGPVYIGKSTIVKTGAKILEGTSLGNVCKVGGEVDHSIFASYANKQHDGFIGHSYIGEWVNIGAGTNNSDLKNNYSAVRMWSAGAIRETGRQFLGLIIGDHSKTGIGMLFNSGTVVGFNCNLFGSALVGKFVPSFSWGQGGQLEPYDLDKALLTAQIVMERRDVKFEDVHKRYFKKIFELSEKSHRNI